MVVFVLSSCICGAPSLAVCGLKHVCEIWDPCPWSIWYCSENNEVQHLTLMSVEELFIGRNPAGIFAKQPAPQRLLNSAVWPFGKCLFVCEIEKACFWVGIVIKRAGKEWKPYKEYELGSSNKQVFRFHPVGKVQRRVQCWREEEAWPAGAKGIGDTEMYGEACVWQVLGNC